MNRQFMRRALSIALLLLFSAAAMPLAGAADGQIGFSIKDDSGRYLEGVTLTLNGEEGEPARATSSQGGYVAFSGVAPGTYYIAVESVPIGYDLDESLRATLTVLQDGTVVHTQDPGATLMIRRTRVERSFPIRDVKGNAVIGAVFNVASSNGAFIENYTSTAEGLVLDLPEGNYRITNVQTPASHAVSTAVCMLSVTNKGVYTYSRNPSDAFVLDISEHTLTFTKRDDGGNPVPGAVFHLAGSGVNALATSDDAGVVAFAGLLAEGSYVLSEESAPSGYQKSASTVSIAVDAAGEYTFDQEPEQAFINQRTQHGLTFTLRDDGGAAVGGARFKLEGGGVTMEAESELGTGRVAFRDIPFGTYILSQTAAPDGNALSSAKVTVTVYSDGTISFSADPAEAFTAQRSRHAFSFTAKDEQGDSLEGATFELGSDAGKRSAKSKSNGSVSFGDLLPGSYTLVQTATPPAFAPSTEKVTVTVAQDGKVTFSNPPEQTLVATAAQFSISFVKRDDIGLPVAGAVFRLVGANNFQREVTANAEGKVAFAELIEGSYTLTERSAPEGYQASTASVSIQVSAIGNIDYSAPPEEAFVNLRAKSELSFLAVDEYGDPLPGAAFSMQGNGMTYEATSTHKGMVYFAKLPHGEYQLNQRAAPQGYTRSPITATVRVLPSGAIRHSISEGGAAYMRPVDTLDGVFISMSGPISFGFTVQTDLLKPLPGAGFSLIEETTGDRLLALSNAAGGVAFYGVQPGAYRIVQTDAPSGYLPSDEVYYAQVALGGAIQVSQRESLIDGEVVTVLMEDQLIDGETLPLPPVQFISLRQRFAVRVRCEDAYGGMPLAGAVFGLYSHPQGELLGMLVTGADGEGSMGHLAPGTYEIKPQSPPSEYAFEAGADPILLRIAQEDQMAVVKAQPVVVSAMAPAGGLDFMANHIGGLIAAGASLLIIGSLLLIAVKR